MGVEDNFDLVNESENVVQTLTPDEEKMAENAAIEDLLFERMVSHIVSDVYGNREE